MIKLTKTKTATGHLITLKIVKNFEHETDANKLLNKLTELIKEGV